MNREQVTSKLALGGNVWFKSINDAIPSWMEGASLCLAEMDDGDIVVISLVSETEVTKADWLAKRRELGLTEPIVTGKPEEWPEERIDAIGQNGHHPDVYDPPEVLLSGLKVGPRSPKLMCPSSLRKDTGAHYREHIVKKALRGTSKGSTERQLVAEPRDALNRWEEMLDEDEGVRP